MEGFSEQPLLYRVTVVLFDENMYVLTGDGKQINGNKIKEIFDPKLGARNSYPDKKITDQGSQITNLRSLIPDH